MGSAQRGDIALDRVVQRDPEIHSGDLVFAGTRVPVDSLVGYLKGGHSVEEFLQDHPTVERWQLESYLDLSSQGQVLSSLRRPDRDALREEPRSDEDRA